MYIDLLLQYYTLRGGFSHAEKKVLSDDEAAGRALKAAGRASKAAGRASEATGRASEQGGCNPVVL